jgi:hypothetical protein
MGTVPMTTLPKSKGLFDKVGAASGATPIPETTIVEDSPSLSRIVIVPDTGPVVVGTKLISTKQRGVPWTQKDCPTGNPMGSEDVKLIASELNGVTVTRCGALACPTIAVPNERLARDTLGATGVGGGELGCDGDVGWVGCDGDVGCVG